MGYYIWYIAELVVEYWGYIKAAVVIAASAYSVEQQRKMKSRMNEAARNAQGITQMFRDPLAPWAYIYGERRVSGPMIFAHEYGPDRKYLYIVVVLAAHPIHNFQKHYFFEEEIHLDGAGLVTDVAYGHKAWVWTQTGQPGSDAFAQLRADLPSMWSAAHKCEGMAAACIKLEYDPQIFNQGIPNYSALVRGKEVYDPRSDTTTWEANPATILADMLTDSKIGGNVPWAAIDTPSVIAAANICDETVPLAGDPDTIFSSKRYSCNKYWSSAEALDKAILSGADSMAGDVVRSGGKWFVIAGEYVTPTVEFGVSDLVGAVRVVPRPSKSSTINRVRGSYVNANEGYVGDEFPSVKNATYLAEDNGEELWHDVDYPDVVDAIQAQRLAKITLERARQGIFAEIKVGLRGLLVKPTDTIMLTLPRFGWDQKVFRVVQWSLETEVKSGGDSSMFVTMTVQETAPSVYSWDMEETTKDPSPDTNLPNPRYVYPPTSAQVEQSTQILFGGSQLDGVKVTWTAPADIYVKRGGYIQARFKASTDSGWTDAGVTVTGEQETMIIPAALFAAAVAYTVEIQAVNGIGALSDWVTCTPDPITLVKDTTPPAAPSGVYVLPPSSYPVPPKLDGVVPMAAYTAFWNASTELDFDHYEWVEVSSPPSSSTVGAVVLTNQVTVYSLFPATGYFYVAAVDKNGNRSGYTASSTIPLPSGTAGTLLAQDSDDATLTGVTVGGGTATPQIQVIVPKAVTHTTVGGAASEDIAISLTNAGFGAAPTSAIISTNKDDANTYSMAYMKSLSSASTAYVRLRRRDGANITASDSVEFSIQLIGHD